MFAKSTRFKQVCQLLLSLIVAMKNRRLSIAAEFHFVHSVEKDSQKHDELTQNSISFSRQSKQVSRCCINFPHQLTCYSGDYIGVSLTNSRESRVAGAKSRSRVQCRGRGSKVAVAGPMSRQGKMIWSSR